MKKVTIYIDTDDSRKTDDEWDDKFIHSIINCELDALSGFGYVLGYTIENIKKERPS